MDLTTNIFFNFLLDILDKTTSKTTANRNQHIKLQMLLILLQEWTNNIKHICCTRMNKSNVILIR